MGKGKKQGMREITRTVIKECKEMSEECKRIIQGACFNTSTKPVVVFASDIGAPTGYENTIFIMNKAYGVALEDETGDIQDEDDEKIVEMKKRYNLVSFFCPQVRVNDERIKPIFDGQTTKLICSEKIQVDTKLPGGGEAAAAAAAASPPPPAFDSIFIDEYTMKVLKCSGLSLEWAIVTYTDENDGETRVIGVEGTPCRPATRREIRQHKAPPSIIDFTEDTYQKILTSFAQEVKKIHESIEDIINKK